MTLEFLKLINKNNFNKVNSFILRFSFTLFKITLSAYKKKIHNFYIFEKISYDDVEILQIGSFLFYFIHQDI